MKKFFVTAAGPDPAAAFLEAGHEDMISYPPTGLAHKSAFRMMESDAGEDPHEAALRLVDDPASPVFGPAAPAGCLPAGEGKFLFFGWRRA